MSLSKKHWGQTKEERLCARVIPFVRCPTCFEPISEEELSFSAYFHAKHPERPLLLIVVEGKVYHNMPECVYTPKLHLKEKMAVVRDASGHEVAQCSIHNMEHFAELSSSSDL